jgi:ABC-2 type transport system ATP-binding protein
VVATAAADTTRTFLISSHVVSELERFCDWLIVLAHGHVQLAGPADGLLAAHRQLTVPRATPDAELPGTVIHRDDDGPRSAVLVRVPPAGLAALERPGWVTDTVSFERLVLGYLQRPSTDNPALAAQRLGQGGKAVRK